MYKQKLEQQIQMCKNIKGRAFLKASETDDDKVADELLTLGEIYGKAELLLQQGYVRSIRLAKKGIDVSTGIVGGEPINHPPAPSGPTPIGQYTAKVEERKFNYTRWKANLLTDVGEGRVSMLDLEDPINTVCRKCGTKGQPVYEGDAEYDCDECGASNSVVNYFYVLNNDV